MDEFPRDLLSNRMPDCLKLEVMEKEEEMELSLGLSMNGRFGVDPSSKKFKKSSSVTNLVFTVESSGVTGPELTRTRSLPTAAEEEWRRRKEWLSSRRLEARKKRMEKLKSLRAMKINGNAESGDGCSENQTQSTCSISATSDLNSNEPKQDLKSVHLQQRRNSNNNQVSESEKSVTEMPYVSTKGEGMNKVDGFLYRYRKGEDVRIVCVCHGLFLSPAEFVKHGGGGDVEYPLKHIVVNPFPLV